MSDKQLTETLARTVLGWKVAPDRFIKPGRSWMPRWRFNPFANLEDAFMLLDRAGGTYTLATNREGAFTAEVRLGDRLGQAIGHPKPRTITIALALALGIEAMA